MRTVWIWINAVVAMLTGFFLLVATITSLHGNYFHALLAIVSWIALIGVHVAATQRNKDRYYWIVWVGVFAAPIFFFAGFLLGHAAMREIEYTTEIWLYFIGIVLVFILMNVFMAFTYSGGGLAQDIKRRFTKTKHSESAMDGSSSSVVAPAYTSTLHNRKGGAAAKQA
jgi:hypothetical protein